MIYICMENQKMSKLKVEVMVAWKIEDIRSARNNPTDIIQRCSWSEDRHTTKSTNDLQEKGKFLTTMQAKDWSMGFDFIWEYTKIITNKLIEYNTQDGRMVSTAFEVLDDDKVKIVQLFDAEKINSEDLQIAWRQHILDNFKKYITNKSEYK